MTCIFCRCSIRESNVEHILPESLGGEEWACLPPGIMCKSCNQYFGSKVEPLALGCFPFLPFRLMLGIPTKKNRPPFMKTHLGILEASPQAGRIGIDPISPDVENAIADGRISQVRILAVPTEPVAVCRLLLKMGLEVLAIDSKVEALSERYDAARNFARAPIRNSRWWFLIHTDHEKLFEKFRRGVTRSEWRENVELRLDEIEGAEIFVCKLLDMTLMIPLVDNVVPQFDDLPEPEYQLFDVQC